MLCDIELIVYHLVLLKKLIQITGASVCVLFGELWFVASLNVSTLKINVRQYLQRIRCNSLKV